MKFIGDQNSGFHYYDNNGIRYQIYDKIYYNLILDSNYQDLMSLEWKLESYHFKLKIDTKSTKEFFLFKTSSRHPRLITEGYRRVVY
jgi:hypothetical protein